MDPGDAGHPETAHSLRAWYLPPGLRLVETEYISQQTGVWERAKLCGIAPGCLSGTPGISQGFPAATLCKDMDFPLGEMG